MKDKIKQDQRTFPNKGDGRELAIEINTTSYAERTKMLQKT